MPAIQLRCLTWNISAAVLNYGAAEVPGVAAAADYIARCLASFKPDVVALQEVPFFDPESEFIDGLAAKAGFAHTYYFPVSPSHLHDNARIGIGVLSRFPLLDARRVDLPNPNLIIDLPDGRSQKTHDKAMIVTKIAHPECPFHFICAHLPPFAEFNRRPGEPMFRELRKVMGDAIRPLASEPVLFAGDINAESMSQLVPELLEEAKFFELIYRVTKGGREICDQIACSPHWTDGTALVIPSKSDHTICVADLTLGTPKTGTAPAVPRSRATILHISDLHLGPGAQEDVDWKQYLEEAERTTRADLLERSLRALPAPPDYVVLSGDFTIGGRPDGLQQCSELLNRLIDEEVFPPVDRVIVVPGNHDVTRVRDGRYAKGEERWTTFKTELADNFVRPWLPGDSPAAHVLREFKREIDPSKSVWGGVRVEPNQRTRVPTLVHFPVLFDRKKRLLFYLFNSASVSGTRIRIDEKTAKVIAASEAVKLHDEEAVKTLVAEIDRLRDVDAARINPDEMYLFQDIMAAIRAAAPGELESATKIVVLHHHIAPIYTEEVKQFELLLNAGQFKKNIVSHGFRLVLHGHKHWPEIFGDTAISGARDARLSVISGGTIGGWSTQPPGFYWIDLREDGGADAAFVALQNDNPTHALDGIPRVDIGLRPESSTTPPPLGRAAKVDLRSLYDACERSMIRLIRRQSIGVGNAVQENVGWNNFLGASSVTPFGTAYGLQVMKFLNAASPQYRKQRQLICETLLRMRRRNLGWSASSLGEPGQPIETAIVLGALSRLVSEDELQQGVDRLVAQIDDPDCRAFLDSTTGVCVVTQTLAELAPQSPALERLVSLLCHGARTDRSGRYLSWGERTFVNPERSLPDDSGGQSAAHTAQVIAALRRVHRQTEGQLGLSAAELGAAADWLLASEWRNAAETVEECAGKHLNINHFTAPMAVLALLLCDCAPSIPRIASTVEELWLENDNGLWWYDQVRWPVWATLSCLEALTEFAFRSTPIG